MTHFKICLAAVVVLCASGAPAWAASSAASSASESVSASVGSISDSIKKSSESSTKKTDVTDGNYRVLDMAELAERPGTVRMTLQAVADAGQAGGEVFFLFVPLQAAERAQIVTGQVVAARQRPYGVEFAKAEKAFFLALDDAWYRELGSNPVVL